MQVRMPVSQFIVKTGEIIREWAAKRNPEELHTDSKLWTVRPKLTLPDYTAATQLLKLNKDVQAIKPLERVYITSSSGRSKLKNADAKSWLDYYEQQIPIEHTEFTEFKEFQARNYFINLDL